MNACADESRSARRLAWWLRARFPDHGYRDDLVFPLQRQRYGGIGPALSLAKDSVMRLETISSSIITSTSPFLTPAS